MSKLHGLFHSNHHKVSIGINLVLCLGINRRMPQRYQQQQTPLGLNAIKVLFSFKETALRREPLSSQFTLDQSSQLDSQRLQADYLQLRLDISMCCSLRGIKISSDIPIETLGSRLRVVRSNSLPSFPYDVENTESKARVTMPRQYENTWNL